MDARFDFITALQYEVKKLRAIVAGFESGERYLQIRNHYLKNLNEKNHTIAVLKKELEEAEEKNLKLTAQIRRSGGNFFIPVKVLRDKFKGKFLALLDAYYQKGQLSFSSSCENLRNHYYWNEFKNSLYETDWCPFIKETFNGFGNAIEYLGRYTHKVAISNSRILSVTESEVTFSARGKKPGEPRRQITVEHTEFIRHFLMHVLPKGFQKIRYYSFLNNRMKTKNLKLIFKLQGYQKFRQRYAGLSMAELLKAVWGIYICTCPVCGCNNMKPAGRTYAMRC